MDFKFTFQDGSEALAHHGVKGMKWGVRKDRGGSIKKLSSKNGQEAGGGGGVPLEDENFVKDDYYEIINEMTDDEEGYRDAAKMILDRERGEGNYSEDELSDYIEIIREWSDDRENGSHKKAAEMIYDRERERKGAKTATQLRKESEQRAEEDKKQIRQAGGWHHNEKLDATKYGYKDNSLESQKAVYEERGLNLKMSKSEGTKKVVTEAKKFYSENPAKATDAKAAGKAAVNRIMSTAGDIGVAQTLYDDESRSKK